MQLRTKWTVLLAGIVIAGPASANGPPPERLIYAVASPPRIHLIELGVWTGGQDARKRLGVGSTISVDATANFRLGYVIGAVGVRPFWERYGLNGDHAGHTADVLGVGIPVTVRVLQYALWVPYLAVTPQLVYSRVRANIGTREAEALRDRIAERTLFTLQLGIGVRLGGHSPLALHVEGGYRLAPTQAIANGDVNLSGAYVNLSCRFGL